MITKWLTIGIILLFVGVTIAPTINFNTVKASTEDDLVEVTTQACGIQGYGNTTVKLTREQYQNLEQYLVEFRARLNQTTTKEEVTALYKEAIVELNDYRLLPKGMSISLAERLVIGNDFYDKLPGFFKRISLLNINDIENMRCFVYAEGVGDVRPLWFDFILETGARILLKLMELGIYILGPLLLIFVIFIYWVVRLFYTLTPIHIFTDVILNHGDNLKLTTISFFPYKIYEGDIENDYELLGYTGLKLITPDIMYFYGRTLFVINLH